MQFQFTSAAILALIMLLVGVHACSAQISRKEHYYFGFEGNLGVKAFNLQSNIAALNNLQVLEEGGTLGVVVGNKHVRARIQAAGFYYSASRVAQTVNLVESAALFNIYPLELFNKKGRRFVDLYLTGGVSYSRMKFFGYYLNEEKANINYSSSEAPYLGRALMSNAVYGGGIELAIPNTEWFRVFAECLVAVPLRQRSDPAFATTTAQMVQTFSIGLSFGSLLY